MNQTFSLSRFARLLRTYLSDNRGSLLINVVLLVGGLAVLSMITYRSYPGDVDHSRYLLLLFVGWASWYVFTMQQVAALNEKERAIPYLLRPASLLEKYLLIILVSGVSFLVVYLTVFTLIDAVGVSYVNHRHWTPEQLTRMRDFGNQIRIEPYYQSKELHRLPTATLVFSALIHPVTLVFALLIRRFALPLVAVVIIGLLILGIVGNEYFINRLFGKSEVNTGLPFSNPLVIRNNDVRRIELPEPIGNQIRYVVGIAAVVLLYVTAFFRLKEREV